MQRSDLLVIGGGIVGLATAYRYTQRFPGNTVRVLEKEPAVARHQTGRNSGVLHSGVYYKPGSLKAVNCREGKAAMEAFCREHEVAFETCGKVIVAVDESDLPALERIEQRGHENGVGCERIGVERLAELEPHARGVAALHVPEAGIVDYLGVCDKLAEQIRLAGGELTLSARVTAIDLHDDGVTVTTPAGEFTAPTVINCAGLHCDVVARMAGSKNPARIVPFRGEYFKLKDNAKHLCRDLIYPTPDPAFPFLGVHFTRMVDGSIECGPNAVLAFAREGYDKRTINLGELTGSLTYGGFVRMAIRHWRMGAGEMWRSVSKAAFVRALQRLVPEITAEALEPAPAGVRAQALTPDGKLVDDFLIDESGRPGARVVNVLNAPSPAATAALKIGETIVERLAT
ncbi:L-2-hydroxyglutarate oxidase LhgO [Pseudobythopirellula maris]|uniref:L-2-hydroxyglutarate oxidase LhgO n=1 Tax=Pseudobythopirellula maris TaxID=2527991 RepID=A0A5C5ZLY4_9BACT|nr:L-2-hydroxyglutarate oxidase [Pseudobythopirellula maris]TWT88462.1 L-2-hydroxyglutarate oxidase LhgO [Pseudobythopirellula maris]